jgi:hypothetical protein
MEKGVKAVVELAEDQKARGHNADRKVRRTGRSDRHHCFPLFRRRILHYRCHIRRLCWQSNDVTSRKPPVCFREKG